MICIYYNISFSCWVYFLLWQLRSFHITRRCWFTFTVPICFFSSPKIYLPTANEWSQIIKKQNHPHIHIHTHTNNITHLLTLTKRNYTRLISQNQRNAFTSVYHNKKQEFSIHKLKTDKRQFIISIRMTGVIFHMLWNVCFLLL